MLSGWSRQKEGQTVKQLTDRLSVHQLGALTTLLLLALWGLAVLWLHLFTPAGADAFEMV
jgi:hypothetical protein